MSDLGGGMTVVAVAWLALGLGPDGGRGALAGIAVAAYVLPGALGALVLGRWRRRLPARRLQVTDAAIRAVPLGAVPLARVAGVLTPTGYVGLLGASSLFHAWGKAGKRASFAPLLPRRPAVTANSPLSTNLWIATTRPSAAPRPHRGRGAPAPPRQPCYRPAMFFVLTVQLSRTRSAR
ncbi:hypothetical protein [Streptomyces sp. NPDC057702]|uniref:hypothetical protein n=1 Tax=unclassified Streptomyces TaxID=2593676 RepID=UPI0036AB58C6